MKTAKRIHGLLGDCRHHGRGLMPEGLRAGCDQRLWGKLAMLAKALDIPLLLVRSRERQQSVQWVKALRLWYAWTRKMDKNDHREYSEEKMNELPTNVALRALQ